MEFFIGQIIICLYPFYYCIFFKSAIRFLISRILIKNRLYLSFVSGFSNVSNAAVKSKGLFQVSMEVSYSCINSGSIRANSRLQVYCFVVIGWSLWNLDISSRLFSINSMFMSMLEKCPSLALKCFPDFSSAGIFNIFLILFFMILIRLSYSG